MQTAAQSTRTIPTVLLPYFQAMVDFSKQKEWATDIYFEKIIPYLEHIIKEVSFKNFPLAIEDLYLLKSYFYKNKALSSKLPRERLIHLQNAIKNCDKLAKDIQHSFFKSILKRKEGFSMSSFLPDIFTKYLQIILEVQLLIIIENEVKTLKRINNSPKVSSLENWVRSELSSQTPETHQDVLQMQYSPNAQPSLIYYFFNGAQHLFLLCQLEYLKMKNTIEDWLYWKNNFQNNSYKITEKIALMMLPSINFVIYLFFLTLLPYRILRTAVNQFSNYIALNFQEGLFKIYPPIAKSKIWIISGLLLQMGLYIGLMLSIGLPLIPLPLASIPELFLSFNLIYIPLLYSSSLLVVSVVGKLVEKNKTPSLEQEVPIIPAKTTMDLDAKQDLIKNPLYEDYCLKQSTLCDKKIEVHIENAPLKKSSRLI